MAPRDSLKSTPKAVEGNRQLTMRLTVLLVLLGIPAIASAQGIPPDVGARIRLTVPCELAPQPTAAWRKECSFTGKLAGLRSDAIDIEIDGKTRSYNLGTVRKFEEGRGSQSRWRLAGC